MPGKTITDHQYRLYMQTRKSAHTQKLSAAKAGFSERTGRRLEKQGILPSQASKRGRKPGTHIFSDIWDDIITPLIQKTPFLSAIILLEHLQDLYPGNYSSRNLRTLQRLLQQWRALEGPDKEIIFRQIHQPGRQGLSDFTTPKTFQVTIQGKPFKHLLYHFRLAYSGWSFIQAVQGGESFQALSQGLQNALWRLGGCPQEHRTDSLSAAYKNLSDQTQRNFTTKYEQLCQHYTMTPTRNNLGKSHENGSIEGPHGHLKRRIAQTLTLRGSSDFESIVSYQSFLQSVVNRHNRYHQKQIDEEKTRLKPLPHYRTIDYEETTARVTTSSTIFVKNVVYSVPSRLIGQRLRIHLYLDHLVCYLGSELTLELPRLQTISGKRQYCINYRHLINSLSCKPQAFRYSMLRDEVLPSPVYRQIWQLLDHLCVSRQACKLMVGILKLAADYKCEEDLGHQVLSLLQKGQVPHLGALQNRYGKITKPLPIPYLAIPQQALACYNQLLSSLGREIAHA
ncbi:IS21 family transposase [Candidatus Odyssella acanthamoebae]|uniref:Integrase catalytic domain-containing protein n=1 Tax=Candidatus Odyssella acanthamoebae TaxID=91604 RepID=A0A077AV11_9PROT|nr:IS21 family transposase [Candidatus Paracaedibacter acanthamoebae]AIK95709.1 hypothetical protein ID47_01580 [Candidatus Paracaedibacter acanthamoebae]AIK96251.1 hypothetical protein ID47_05080 [Candidatus Paracaedibacter acanthamoebae]AIK96593.1 hypothetical protein ID47_07445 [Candidatus Paracaedibacter acanthamoebae]